MKIKSFEEFIKENVDFSSQYKKLKKKFESFMKENKYDYEIVDELEDSIKYKLVVEDKFDSKKINKLFDEISDKFGELIGFHECLRFDYNSYTEFYLNLYELDGILNDDGYYTYEPDVRTITTNIDYSGFGDMDDNSIYFKTNYKTKEEIDKKINDLKSKLKYPNKISYKITYPEYAPEQKRYTIFYKSIKF